MTTFTPYPAIVFDLDGTLLDTWPSLLAAVRAVAPASAPSLDPTALRLALSQGVGPMFKRAAAQLAGPEDGVRPALFAAMSRHYLDHTLVTATPYAGTGALLAGLRAAGHTLAVCTNRDRASTLTLLAHHEWRAHFSHVHCLDDGLPPKPDGAPLLATLERVGHPSGRALFVGDSQVDARCAQAARVDFAAHRGGYHARPGDLTPAVFTYDHAGDLTHWIASHPTRVLETEDD
ncbi:MULTISPECIES: HAD family hydrolase [Achromobacter]|uniref:HAD family hydrolase n=1 Tax=Achromobacter TaxID=222 RepID=UPI001F146C99|nr:MULTISPECIES: HAD hydrolase-like protein [Achromobacter]